MNRRSLLKFFALAMLAAGTAPLVAPSLQAAPPSKITTQPKGLKVGDKVRYDGKGLVVTFLAVRNDNRCPINARCISAGDAEVVLKVKAGNQKAKVVTLHTHDKPRYIVIPANKLPEGTAGIPKSYIIRLKALSPGREIGKKIRQKDYRLNLAFSTAL